MFELIVGFAAGIIVGWNVFPQPAFIAKIYAKLFGGM